MVGPAAIAAEGPWICSLTEAVECAEGMGCVTPDFQGVEPPTFFHVDLDRKVVTLLAPESRRGETNRIELARETDRGWIVAGTDAARVWNLYLTRDGTMTLTVTMDGTTWTGFGQCLLEDAARP